MNYRHIFHAGNFADLVKHALLTTLLARFISAVGPLAVIDTHAGAGLYDIGSGEAARSGEAEAGIGRLMADAVAPAVFDGLKAAVNNLNTQNTLHRYPGSPWLISRALREGDRLTACELRQDDFAALRRAVTHPRAELHCADGYGLAAERIRADSANLVLIDPPFERGDEYSAITACAQQVLQRDRAAAILIWLPLKDLETFDGFLRGLEALGLPPTLVAETRLRPLSDPMRMNGCALVVINDPPGTEQAAGKACGWVARTLGETGAAARIWRL